MTTSVRRIKPRFAPLAIAVRAAGALALITHGFACPSPDTTPDVTGYLVDDEGTKIFYRTLGSGPETVLIPAGLYLEEALAPLARGRRLVFFDPPGRGRSDPIDSLVTSFDRNVRTIETVRRLLGIDQMALIGWSGLGKEIAVYASRHPSRVSRIVQISPVPPTSGPYPNEPGVGTRADRIDAAMLSALESRRTAGEFAGRSEALCRELNQITRVANFADTALAARAPDVCQYRNEWPEHINPYFRALVGSQGVHDWRDSIRVVAVPRLIIHGREDPIPLSGGRAWAAGDSLARLLVISPSGHFPFIEQPEVVLAAIATFLDGRWPLQSRPVADRR